MSMSASVRATEWKPQDSGGKRSQAEMPFLAEVAELHTLPQAIVSRASYKPMPHVALKEEPAREVKPAIPGLTTVRGL